jgi:hypothetical protein
LSHLCLLFATIGRHRAGQLRPLGIRNLCARLTGTSRSACCSPISPVYIPLSNSPASPTPRCICHLCAHCHISAGSTLPFNSITSRTPVMPVRDRAKRIWNRIHPSSSRNHTPVASSNASINDSGTSEPPLPSSSNTVVVSNESGPPANLSPSAGTRTVPTSNIGIAPLALTSRVTTPAAANTANEPLAPSAEAAPSQLAPPSSSSPASKQDINAGVPHSGHVIPPSPRSLSDITPIHVFSSPKKLEQNAKRMAWSGLKAFGEVLRSGASTLGPLKTAVEGITGCIEFFEVRVPITYLISYM